MPGGFFGLRTCRIEGFKSFRAAVLEVRSLNVLIGANGAGKSNLAAFFQMLHEIGSAGLQRYIGKSGGASALLCGGPKQTSRIVASLDFREGARYDFGLELSGDGSLFFSPEHAVASSARLEIAPAEFRVTGARESFAFVPPAGRESLGEDLRRALTDIRAIHLHDTSATAALRQSVYLHDNRQLRSDAGNLAAIIYRLRGTRPACYERICGAIRQFAPWFGDFVIQPLELDPQSVRLDWRHADSDAVYGAHQLSDGTLRAMALTVLLMQPPEDLPSIIVVDEPELGLHPHALVMVAGMISAASETSQVIVATQSPTLVDQFEAEDIVVVDRDKSGSRFSRLEPDRLADWLKDYTLGELWEKNVIAGGSG